MLDLPLTQTILRKQHAMLLYLMRNKKFAKWAGLITSTGSLVSRTVIITSTSVKKSACLQFSSAREEDDERFSRTVWYIKGKVMCKTKEHRLHVQGTVTK